MLMSPPLGSNFYVTTPSKDVMYPQLGEVGHIVDSCIIDDKWYGRTLDTCITIMRMRIVLEPKEVMPP